jgi:F-type H+-transporting ATPase subunit a
MAALCTIIPGLPAADRFALDHGGTGPVRVRGRAAVRHRGAGFGRYLKSYAQPTFIMLPFNIISEISRTLALAVRLFGNMMSGR